MSPSQYPPDAFLQRLRAVGAAGRQLVLNSGRNDGPPDLDELWRDFNRKLGGLFGGKRGGRGNGSGGGDDGSGGGSGGPSFQPDMKSAGIGAGLIAGVVALIWLGSGIFIVQEGQQAVVTSFGKYSHTADAGLTNIIRLANRMAAGTRLRGRTAPDSRSHGTNVMMTRSQANATTRSHTSPGTDPKSGKKSFSASSGSRNTDPP